MFIPCMRHQKLRLAGAERRGVEDICRWNIDGCIILRAISERDKMEMERIEAGMSGEKERETRKRDALISRYPPPLPPSVAFFGAEHRGDARMNIPPAHFLISSILFAEICPYTAYHIANADRKIVVPGLPGANVKGSSKSLNCISE